MKKKEEEKKDYAGPLRESAHKIWLAGLGALATAEEEGTKLFKSLVSKGEEYEGSLRTGTDKVKSQADKAKERVEKAWETLESSFDEKVGAALHRVGVPSRDEIAELTRKVEKLTETIEALSRSKGGEPEQPA